MQTTRRFARTTQQAFPETAAWSIERYRPTLGMRLYYWATGRGGDLIGVALVALIVALVVIALFPGFVVA